MAGEARRQAAMRRRVLWIAALASAFVFLAVQDRVVQDGAREYADRQGAAIAAGGPRAEADAVMRPWIRRSVALGAAWASLPLLGGVGVALWGRRHG